MDTTAQLTVRQLQCERGEHILFSKLDLDLHAGEICHVQGINGSGKTTLLRTIAGYTKPYAGQITWQSQSASLSNPDFTRQMRYVGHRNALKSGLTARENLTFLASLYKDTNPSRNIDLALEYFSLKHKSAFSVSELSQGQQRKTSLARLMLGESALWLLDEPFTSLDSEACLTLENLIENHLKNRGCVLIATHRNLELTGVERKTLELAQFHV